jgi:hypothetical protein
MGWSAGSAVKRYKNNFWSLKWCSWRHFLPPPRLNDKGGSTIVRTYVTYDTLKSRSKFEILYDWSTVSNVEFTYIISNYVTRFRQNVLAVHKWIHKWIHIVRSIARPPMVNVWE